MTHSYPKIRLFVEPQEYGAFSHGMLIERTGDAAHYLSRVMRLKESDEVALFNGENGEWRARITHLAKKNVSLTLSEQLRSPLTPPDVWVCFAPIKFGRIDYLVQKMTELGAAKLQPTLTHYTQSHKVNETRLRANMIEAAEQCERCDVPALAAPLKLPDLLANWPADRALIFADESGKGAAASHVLSQPCQKWGILIGPEGGFSPDEAELIYRISATKGISLGPRILRADTAALTLLSLTMAAWGDWDIAPHFLKGPTTRDD